jgi:hypothetical protein
LPATTTTSGREYSASRFQALAAWSKVIPVGSPSIEAVSGPLCPYTTSGGNSWSGPTAGTIRGALAMSGAGDICLGRPEVYRFEEYLSQAAAAPMIKAQTMYLPLTSAKRRGKLDARLRPQAVRPRIAAAIPWAQR